MTASKSAEPTAFDLALARRIKDAREACGLSVRQVSLRLGARWQTVAEWEKGTARPSVEYLRAYAEMVQVSTDELLGVAAGQDPPYAAWPLFLATREGRVLDADARRSLQAFVWPHGVEPDVTDYVALYRLVDGARRRL